MQQLKVLQMLLKNKLHARNIFLIIFVFNLIFYLFCLEYGLTVFDFSKNAIKIVNKVSEMNKLKIESLYFDIINPDNLLKLKTNSAVFTVFSLEQVSNKFYDFILFLLK